MDTNLIRCIQELQAQQGWTDATLLQLLLDYLDEKSERSAEVAEDLMRYLDSLAA